MLVRLGCFAVAALFLFASRAEAGTYTFTGAGIDLPDAAPGTPYPAVIEVADVPGTVLKVTLTLHGFEHAWSEDVLAVLQGPNQAVVEIMGGCGFGTDGAVELTFDDDAAAQQDPDADLLVSGTFKPGPNYYEESVVSPGPQGPYATSLSALAGDKANGSWQLWIQDTIEEDGGRLTGWTLTIETAE